MVQRNYSALLPERLAIALNYSPVEKNDLSGNKMTPAAVWRWKNCTLNDQEKLARFEREILPHLDAAHNLARWLTGDEHDAEDVLQEASLRALKFIGGFRGGNIRAWLLTIVRNTAYTWLKQNRNYNTSANFEETAPDLEDHAANPESLMIRNAHVSAVRQALTQIQVEFREAIILREMEGLSYKEIADVAGVPIGTVMSRLARGREAMKRNLSTILPKGSARP